MARMKEVMKGTTRIGGRRGQVKLKLMSSATARIDEKIAALESSTEFNRPRSIDRVLKGNRGSSEWQDIEHTSMMHNVHRSDSPPYRARLPVT